MNTTRFKLGKTLPIKFKLIDTNGTFVTNATAHIFVSKVNGSVIEAEQQPVATNAPDSGNTFRYDDTDNQYIFNNGISYNRVITLW